MVAIVLLFLASLSTEAWSEGERATLPLTFQPTPLKEGCPSREAIAQIQLEVDGKLQEIVNPGEQCKDRIAKNYTQTQEHCNATLETAIAEVYILICQDHPGEIDQCPASSCSEISHLVSDPPSGYYWIRVCNGSPVQVYCNMDSLSSNYYHWITRPNGSIARVHCDPTKDCCDIFEGWTKVAYLDMNDLTHQCPSGWREMTEPKRACGRMNDESCDSATFATGGTQYSRVCSRVIGYEYGTPDAFARYYINPDITIDSYYVDGISITHGTPRQHIWTLVGELGERNEPYHSNFPVFICPCTAGSDTTIPSWIGEDYFCESGTETWGYDIFYLNDPLWDGEGCGNSTTCCSYNHPPWFCKELPQPTTDDIEVRICSDQPLSNEDTPIELIELYIH